MRKFFICSTCMLAWLLAFPSCQTSPVGASNSLSASIAPAGKGLQAYVRIVFTSNDFNGEYQASTLIEKGEIRTGDKLHAVGKDGTRYSFSVTSIDIKHEQVEVATAGDEPFLVLQTEGKAPEFDEGFYLVEEGGSYPAGDAKAQAGVTSNAKAEFTANINGQPWAASGFFNSALFYAKGNSMFKVEQPMLVLAFKATDSPDSRQLNIHVKGFEAKTGVVPKAGLEVLLSGAASGKDTDSQMASNYHEGNASKGKSPFTVEITDWQMVSADEAIISGKLSGTLNRLLAKQADRVENGRFEKVRVRVFNEKY